VVCEQPRSAPPSAAARPNRRMALTMTRLAFRMPCSPLPPEQLYSVSRLSAAATSSLEPNKWRAGSRKRPEGTERRDRQSRRADALFSRDPKGSAGFTASG
jgi:hypothetical protein